MLAVMCARYATLLLSVAAVTPLTVSAQEYPSRPIRFIVGFVPGGISDLLTRALAQKLTDAWGQQVIVDNRAGGGGVISMQLVAKAAPDGYTLLMGSSTQFSINPALRRNLPYDPVRDYTPVTNAAITPVILTVQATSAARSLQELIQLAKKPGEVMSYGSTGYGGAPHIAGELLKRAAGISMTHVPFKGGGDSIIAIMGGHVQASFGAVSTAQPHLRGGRLRALGVTTLKRLSAIPEVPTFAEQGLPGFEVVQWYGVFAPAGLPPPILRKANETLVRALGMPEFREQFNGHGVELMQSTPTAFAGYVKSELARWTKVLKEMGINEAP
ncbi:MAG TPA: tripartite tricarboxylate transporter substrate binding protein [Burkholderiales bacterium]|nr:tripartite tricarboxylate transporter substrate binding protein [Burkholderiales bacterium]